MQFSSVLRVAKYFMLLASVRCNQGRNILKVNSKMAILERNFEEQILRQNTCCVMSQD